ncbi:MAG: AraC family transcriptional regulator [Oleiphilaceae bacterium]|nr:AraC family transcriptional regulator [Oleiphilaceae bacterium]
MASINTHYILSALGGAKKRGIDSQSLLNEAGIDQSKLSHPNSRFDVQQVALLYDGIAKRLNDEFMGFTEHPIKVGTFELMTDWVSTAHTLRELYERAIRFYNQITDELQMSLEIQGEHVYLTTELRQPELDFEHFYIEYWHVIWHRFGCWYIDQPIKLVSAYINYDPIDPIEFSLLFRCPTNFKSKFNRLVFHRSYLDMPLIKTPTDLRNFLKNAPVDLLTIPGEDTSISAKARQLIEPRQLRNEDRLSLLNSRELSEKLGMSEPTLRRKLSAEGSSIQSIKNDVRFKLAKQQLKATNFSIADIALQLGFSESRAFSRAFKQWSGLNPQDYRDTRSPH